MPVPESVIVYALQVNESSVADDFPFQSDWEKRQVNGQDWATFINYLLPNHTTRGNDALIDRKLHAEDQASEHHHSNSARSEASAQLEHLRDNVATSPVEGSQPPRRAQLEATVRQWNDGFFHPRGIDVQLLPADPTSTVPGAWDPSFDQTRNVDAAAAAEPSSSAAPRSRYGLSMDSNGIRLGNFFVADENGLKIGSLVMDENGVRYGGKGKEKEPMVQQDRGRSFNDDCRNHRSRSSSVSSDSSSSSDSSIGSLPDYDDVKGAQLPVYRALLQDWMSSPETMRSKADVKVLKAKLKEVKNAPAPEDMDKNALRAQIKGLAAQWKHIKRQQKRSRREFKRAKRQLRRAERRERRQGRREIKRAERDWRRSERHHRRGGPCPTPPVPLAPLGVSVPPVPPPPSAPHGIPTPFEPNHPDFPLGPNFPFGGRGRGGCRGGWGGGFGRGGGRRGFAEHNLQGPQSGRGLFATALGKGMDMYRNRNIPGAWDSEQRGTQAVPSPGPAAAAKYRQVEQMRTNIAQHQGQADQLQPGPQKDALEKSIEAMEESMERLEVEADEEYAMDVGHSSKQ